VPAHAPDDTNGARVSNGSPEGVSFPPLRSMVTIAPTSGGTFGVAVTVARPPESGSKVATLTAPVLVNSQT
jgi:hypothetical protein